MRQLERLSGIAEAVLQERAGAAVADEVARLLQPGEAVTVVAGHGNNGRDGAVAARRLAERGTHVDLLLGPGHAVKADELAALRAMGVRVGAADKPGAVEACLQRVRVAVDAIAGIGTNGALRAPLAQMAAALNQVRQQRGEALVVLAVDVPSGVDADTGEVPGEAVWADVTVTLGAVKDGLLRFPAADHVGRLVPREIGLPTSGGEDDSVLLLEPGALRQALPRRPQSGHKYTFGRVLVVAGSEAYVGAALLAASAAARAGAGLVTLACPNDVRRAAVTFLPEATYAAADLRWWHDPGEAIEVLLPLLESHSCLVIGPGMGRTKKTVRFIRDLLIARAARAETTPAILDADALFALVGWERWWERVGANVVLTPHGGELARLAPQVDSSEVPWRLAGPLAREWGVTLVAKGPHTSVASDQGQVQVWPSANAALATGGTGDVLAGIIGGLVAQGASAFDASRVGVAVHALAAASLLADRGWRTLLASDLLQQVPVELRRLERRA